jgi:hypothetical protein
VVLLQNRNVWVYQEQTSGDIDTITVYYDWEGTNGDGTVVSRHGGNSSYDGFNYKYNFNSLVIPFIALHKNNAPVIR